MLDYKGINHILEIQELQESVLLIALATAQIEASMNEGDHSVNVLVDSFKSMSNSIKESIKSDNDPRFVRLKRDIDASIVSFQFYDRLNQRLEHVSKSLVLLANLVSSDEQVKAPEEWDKLKEKIRKSYSMESEHDLFKLLYDDGLSVREALNIIKKSVDTKEPQSQNDDNIEFF